MNQQMVGKPIQKERSYRNWYVAYTAPRAEKRVAQRLEAVGIEYFLPLREDFRQWSDRFKKIQVPAFPSYIFVHVDNNEYFDAINQDGMVKYVQFGGISAIVNENTMISIRKIVEINSIPELCDNLPSLGSIYKIPSGPLKGFEGKVIRLKGKTHFFFELKEWGKYIILPFSSVLK